MNNWTMLYEQLHNAVRTTGQRCVKKCTTLYEQLHNAVRTTGQRCKNNKADHRFVIILPTIFYSTIIPTLLTFPKGKAAPLQV
jgi:hypothetical protein